MKYTQCSTILVVPTLNESANIRACLLSLISQAPLANIVVVDGNSIDNTRKIVRDMARNHVNLTLIENPECIQSHGINLAVAVCAKPHHQILIRCDAHAIYPPQFVAKIITSFNTHDVAGVVVPMDSTGKNGFGRAAAWIVDSVLGNGGAKHRGGSYSGLVDHGHHAGMRLDWFKSLAGYDASFSHNEDAEYDHRVVRAGGRIWMNADARVTYNMRGSISTILQQYFNYGHGRARTLAKHRIRPKLRQRLPTLNLILLSACLIGPLWWPTMVWIPIAYLMVLLVVSLTAVMRLRQLSGLWAGPALAFMHNAWAVGFVHFKLRGMPRG